DARRFNRDSNRPGATRSRRYSLSQLRAGGPFRERIDLARKTGGGRLEAAISEGIHGANRKPGLRKAAGPAVGRGAGIGKICFAADSVSGAECLAVSHGDKIFVAQ